MKPFHRKELVDACAKEVYIQLRYVLKDIGDSRDTFRHFKEDLLPFPYENLEDEDTTYFKNIASHLLNIFINSEMKIEARNLEVCKNCKYFYKLEACSAECKNKYSMACDYVVHPYNYCSKFEKAVIGTRGVLFLSESVNRKW